MGNILMPEKKKEQPGLLGNILGTVGSIVGGMYGGPAGAAAGGAIGSKIGGKSGGGDSGTGNLLGGIIGGSSKSSGGPPSNAPEALDTKQDVFGGTMQRRMEGQLPAVEPTPPPPQDGAFSRRMTASSQDPNAAIHDGLEALRELPPELRQEYTPYLVQAKMYGRRA